MDLGFIKIEKIESMAVIDKDTGELYMMIPVPTNVSISEFCPCQDHCLAYPQDCAQCGRNRLYKGVPKSNLYKPYEPTCPKGYDDCVIDPAYIKFYHPEWYKSLYGDISPKEAAKIHCSVEDEWCYDDEDK